MSTERSSTQSPPSTLVPSQRHSPIGAEGSDDDDNVEEEELAANDDNDNDAWDSWGDPEEAEKVSTSPIDPQMSKPTPIEPTVMSKPQSDIASGGAKKFVDADLSMMDIKVRVLPDGEMLMYTLGRPLSRDRGVLFCILMEILVKNWAAQ